MREQNINVFLFLKTVLIIYPRLLGSQNTHMGCSLSCLAPGMSMVCMCVPRGDREAHVVPYTLLNPLCLCLSSTGTRSEHWRAETKPGARRGLGDAPTAKTWPCKANTSPQERKTLKQNHGDLAVPEQGQGAGGGDLVPHITAEGQEVRPVPAAFPTACVDGCAFAHFPFLGSDNLHFKARLNIEVLSASMCFRKS